MTKLDVQTIKSDGQYFAKVRIAVMVDSTGRWIAAGHWQNTASAARNKLRAWADTEPGDQRVEPGQIHWVYALIPVPDEQVLEGNVARDIIA